MVLASPFPAPRGTQAWVSELCRALGKLRHEVHLFCYGEGLGGSLPPEAVIHRAPVVPFVRADLDSRPRLARPFNDALLLSTLMRTVRALEPTVIHGHNHEGGIAAAIAGRVLQVPVVHQIHGSLAEELSAWTGAARFSNRPMRRASRTRAILNRGLTKGAGGFGSVLDHLVPRLADWVLTLDQDALETASLEKGRVTVLPPGVSRPPYLSSFPKLPEDVDWVVYPGNLDPYQSLHLLVAAWPRVLRELPRARLALVTHDDGPKELATMPGVCLIRAKSHMEALSLLGSARAVVIPRTGGGGYPIKMLNALGLGVPVVACEPAAKGLGKESGVLAVASSADALSSGILRLLRDRELQRSLSTAARAFCEANPWRAVAEVVAGVYDLVCHRLA